MKNRNKGFTMMEVLITMTLITVLAAAAIGNSFYTKRSSALLQQKMIALQLIDKRFSEIKKDDGKSLTAGSVLIAVPELLNGQMTAGVTSVGTDPALKQVTLTVGWRFPWKPCSASQCSLPSAQDSECSCDKTETATTIFYSDYAS